MDGYPKSSVDAFMRRFRWLLILCVAVCVVPLLGLWIYLDWRFRSFETDLSYRPPHASGVETVNPGELPLNPVQTATLSIRNTDLKQEILVTSVRYYDTSGQEVKSHVDKPLRVGALATVEFVVARDDTTGGSGANFIVEWIASRPVSPPVIETVMIGTSGNQGISFARTATVIEETLPDLKQVDNPDRDKDPSTQDRASESRGSSPNASR